MAFAHKRHLFFDLDHTLWDFDKNAEETLKELYESYRFDQLGLGSADAFIESYTRNNHRLWALYHHGKIDRETLRTTRFQQTFADLGIEPTLFPQQFEEDYIRICPQKTHLFPHAHETLDYLGQAYNLHLISNGFKEGAETKLHTSGLRRHFQTIVISDDIGIRKPHPGIFMYALNGADATKQESIMIGDSLDADVRGALDFGIDAIFFNPNDDAVPSDVTQSIRELKELTLLF
ncbi:putative hydrolase of the HAD superfamily [bacterium A37T11]|nr:putative hydrolase of the HAD superfamily [bacterium A37T11]